MIYSVNDPPKAQDLLNFLNPFIFYLFNLLYIILYCFRISETIVLHWSMRITCRIVWVDHSELCVYYSI